VAHCGPTVALLRPFCVPLETRARIAAFFRGSLARNGHFRVLQSHFSREASRETAFSSSCDRIFRGKPSAKRPFQDRALPYLAGSLARNGCFKLVQSHFSRDATSETTVSASRNRLFRGKPRAKRPFQAHAIAFLAGSLARNGRFKLVQSHFSREAAGETAVSASRNRLFRGKPCAKRPFQAHAIALFVGSLARNGRFRPAQARFSQEVSRERAVSGLSKPPAAPGARFPVFGAGKISNSRSTGRRPFRTFSGPAYAPPHAGLSAYTKTAAAGAGAVWLRRGPTVAHCSPIVAL
jgi:hypothetical protein